MRHFLNLAKMSYRCTDANFRNNRTKHDGLPTNSYYEQTRVEDSIENCYRYFKNLMDVEPELPELHKQKHEVFLRKGLMHLSEGYQCLDASRPWLCYWILHSMELLEVPISDDMASRVAGFLGRCQCADGGFSGGPGQQAHLAPTYAAVNALCILGREIAYKVIDRKSLQKFLMSVRTTEGAFEMHAGGEADIRGAYCALSAAHLTNVATPEMFDGTAEWVVRCQTYEGGFAGCPGLEAHGGYSFCGVASLVMLGKEHLCDVKALLRWTVYRQMAYEGGFQGRTNKLVDGCYSFWQGGALPLIHLILAKEGDPGLSTHHWMFHQGALQEYLLICCQHAAGGLIDKPGKPRDFYHTCYCLSGMSVAQHFSEGKILHRQVLGTENNELQPTHPLFNICPGNVQLASQYFNNLSVPGVDTATQDLEKDSPTTPPSPP